MKNTLENKEKAIQYLYGELVESERDSFEDNLFADEEFGLFVEDVENDLIDEYVRGELSFEEKREFESKYLTTDSRHERVILARTLQNELFTEETLVSTEETSAGRGFLGGLFRLPNLALAGGLATVLLIFLLGGILITRQPTGIDNKASGGNENVEDNITPVKEDSPEEEIPPTPLETPNEEPEINKPAESNNSTSVKPQTKQPVLNKVKKKPTPKPVRKKPKPVKKPKTVRRQPKVFAFSLLPPLRSSQTPVIKIPQATQTVRLSLFDSFGEKYEKFVVEVSDNLGNLIWRQEIKASGKKPQKSIRISIPGISFKEGNHEVSVSGVTGEDSSEDIAFYNFVVQREKEKKD